MRQETELEITQFDKEISKNIKEIIEEKLKVSKSKAKSRILKKLNFCHKQKGSGKDEKAKNS